ncbi:MAG: hypothetical protein ONB46_11550 [candidate division KSB1 bacterium]|nr:hypothetical protein [candidate division KSB1 bacterium]MDZ7366631.1 hypothetical protein [candidate division KSB1 bacterium]MDZ7404642.1 hypothetical protein [candidate division KSB1 bacterium]
MSVLKMIVADDQHYLSGEPHGSCAQWIYAACSRSPKSLNELERLLPEFGADSTLRSLLSYGSLELEPFDAGLIIVDLAKKWIYAEDSYFGAHRTGSYTTRDDGRKIEYRFSDEWQFVSEPKWFRYLYDLNLKSYDDLHEPANAGADDGEFFSDDFELEDEPALDDDCRNDSYSDVTFTNRICGLVYFEPQNTDETRDYQTLEHIAGYDNDAAAALHGIEREKEKIASLKVELQAAENLWKRTGAPRWEIKCRTLQTRLGKHEKTISRLLDEHRDAAAMAAELRNLLATDKGRNWLKDWEEDEKASGDMELPY